MNTANGPKKLSRNMTKHKNEETPLFLRKTYHMIDTCDASIASWSDDGETFVVRDTDKFEKEIIPQFFKHSKFSSFVRQLNFYGFRKIKYSDTIRIDPKLEAETANFWRFRHEKFLRGKPELLIEIKRSNSQPASSSPTHKKSEKPEDVKSLRTEVSTLKERIARMSKNIGELTSLVQNMEINEKKSLAKSDFECNDITSNKRKKVTVDSDLTIEGELRSADVVGVTSDISFSPGAIFPFSELSGREESATTSLSDEAFVDELLADFGEDNIDFSPDSLVPGNLSLNTVSQTSTDSSGISASETKGNAPDRRLMEKLSDALSLLPKDVQEILVDRLVSAITNTDSVKNNVDAVSALSEASIVENDQECSRLMPVPSIAENCQTQEIALPLAAATLGALLAQYGDIKNKSFVTKSLPVIPAHA